MSAADSDLEVVTGLASTLSEWLDDFEREHFETCLPLRIHSMSSVAAAERQTHPAEVR